MEYPLSELKKYFRGEDNSESAAKKAYINFFFVEKKIEEIERMAKEIDEEYTKNKEDSMKRVDFEGDVWKIKDKEPNQELLSLLISKNCLIVLRNDDYPYRVVIGVPHQAAIGEEHICEKGNKRSDENAASYALVAFTRLKENHIPCKLVIAAHSTATDPNKDLKSPYCEEMFRNTTELLLECHGAAKHRVLDFELSAGKNALSNPEKFGRLLASELEWKYTLGVQEKPGEEKAFILEKDGTERKGKLENPAINTNSLDEAGKKKIPALHLEAKPAFRKPVDRSNTVTPDGAVLGQALAQTIIKYCAK